MSAGQGSISFSEPPGSSGGGGGGTLTGAESGVSLVGTDVILGNNAADVGDPGALLWNTRTAMAAFVSYYTFNGDQAFNWGLNDQSEGGGANTIPTAWRSTDSSYWSVWQPGNYDVDYTPFGTGGRFMSAYSLYPGVNEPVTARPNMVGMFWGYNTDYQQGQLIGGEAAFRYATESFFVIGFDPFFEFHTPEMTTSGGYITRLDSLYYDRLTAVGFRNWQCDNFNIYSREFDVPTGMAYFITEYIPGSDTAGLSIRSINPGGVSAISLQNYSTGNGTISYQDGELFVQAQTRLDLRGQICALDATISTNVVSPCIFSDDNTDSPGGDAQLEVSSVPLLGVRLPRMTTAQRNAIPAIAGQGGLVVFVTDSLPNGKLSIWTGVSWEIVTSV
jgi:hypothetical protein